MTRLIIFLKGFILLPAILGVIVGIIYIATISTSAAFVILGLIFGLLCTSCGFSFLAEHDRQEGKWP